jgi:hypothetical protein
MENQEAEVFIRYVSATKMFEAKLGSENAPSMSFPEDKVDEIKKVMTPQMNDVFMFLVREAKKDVEGKWVSASTKPAQKGQATVAGR